MKIIITNEQVNEICKQISKNIPQGSLLYGIPRGGIAPAYLLAGMTNGIVIDDPGKAQYFIDDLVDSGRTRQIYEQMFPGIPFITLFTKQLPSDWYVFPWEVTASGEDVSAEDIFTRFLEFVGEDPNREGLLETPKRMAKAWKFWTSGYGQDPDSVFKEFSDGGEHYDEMVLLDPIPFFSHCVVGSTFVETPKGRVPIKYLNDGDWIYTVDPETKELGLVRCQNPRLTRKDAELVRVYSDNDSVLCTPDHRFLTHNRGWVEAQNLQTGDSVVSLYRSLNDSGHVNLIASRATRWADQNGAIKIDNEVKGIHEHQFVFGITNNLPIRGQNGRTRPIHHKNERKWDNQPLNLEKLSIHLHNEKHKRFNGENNIRGSENYEKRKRGAAESSGREEVKAKRSASVKAYWDKVRSNPQVYEERCKQTSEGIQLSGRNHKIIGVEPVEWKEDVYCMNVPGTQTFFANGMAVHNCEHHMAAIFGEAHIAYIPNQKIAGLSKFARLVDIFARRLQVQERITFQIADAIEKNLQPLGVAVFIKATHFCIASRGVQKVGTSAKTSALRGVFKEKPAARAEFFSLLKL